MSQTLLPTLARQLLMGPCLACLSITAALTAQTTLPKGADSIEGTSFWVLNNQRVQGADFSYGQKAGVFKSWAVRRDGTAAITTGGGTANVLLQMGVCDMGSLTTNHATNYVGTPTTVFSNTSLSLPNWTTAPTTPPATFDFVLPFTSAWLYTGKQPLLWDLTISNATNLTNRCDRYLGTSVTGSGVTTGPGCGTFTNSLVLRNSGIGAPRYGMQAQVSVVRPPLNQPILISADLTVSGITIPGWCSPIYAAPTFLLPFGSAAKTTSLIRTYAFPYLKIAQGLKIVTQAVSTDTSGIVLSNGSVATMPTSTATNGVDACYIPGGSVLSPSLVSGPVFNSAIIVQLK